MDKNKNIALIFVVSLLILSTSFISAEDLNVDLKVNGKDSPDPVNYKEDIKVSWTSEGNIEKCNGYGHWVPLAEEKKMWNDLSELPSSGSKKLEAAFAYSGDFNQTSYMNELDISIQCWEKTEEPGNLESVSDTVKVPVKKPEESEEKEESAEEDGGETEILEKTISMDETYDLAEDYPLTIIEISEEEVSFKVECPGCADPESGFPKTFSLSLKESAKVVESPNGSNYIEAIVTGMDLEEDKVNFRFKSVTGAEGDEGEGAISPQVFNPSISEGETYTLAESWPIKVDKISSGKVNLSITYPSTGATKSITNREAGDSFVFDRDYEGKYIYGEILEISNKVKFRFEVRDDTEETEKPKPPEGAEAEEKPEILEKSKTVTIGETYSVAGKYDLTVNEISENKVKFQVKYPKSGGGEDKNVSFEEIKKFEASPEESVKIVEVEEGYIKAEILEILLASENEGLEEDKVNFRFVSRGEGAEAEEKPEGQKICSTCEVQESCVPIGFRNEGQYCSLDSGMINQSLEGEKCSNNFECKSNVCANGECVSQGLLNKILNWFKKLFG